MKLNYWFKSLRVAILGLFSISMLTCMGVVANAGHVSDKKIVLKSDVQKVRDLFFLNGSEVPTFWRNPVVPAFYDATRKHNKLLNKAEIFALYYAAASKTKTINDEGVNGEPTLAFVIADHIIEDLHLAEPLKSILSEKWKGFLVSEAPNWIVTQYRVNGVLDGTNCSLFMRLKKKTNPSRYLVEAAAIIANSSMSESDILSCFKNKTALVFGVAPSTFDYDRGVDLQTLDSLYFGHYPAFLDASSTCREIDIKNIFACVANTMGQKYNYLLDALSHK